jgi:hypothetical protein
MQREERLREWTGTYVDIMPVSADGWGRQEAIEKDRQMHGFLYI